MIRRDRDRAEHARLREAVARQRLDRGELLEVEIVARRPELALDLTIDEIRETRRQLIAQIGWQREAAIFLRGFVGHGEQIRGERGAAGRTVVVGGGK